MARIARVPGVFTLLGESPVWDAQRQALWLIDMAGNAILQLADDDSIKRWPTPSAPGAIALASDGRLAVALESGFATFDPVTAKFSAETPAGIDPESRITEGKADREGRLLGVSGDWSAEHRPNGSAVRWEPDGSVTRLFDGVRLGNCLAWSRDGRTMYLGDSIDAVIRAYDYAPDGSVTGERIFHSFEAAAFPDGATVDAQDHLWVAMHQSPWVLRFAPDGRLVERIELPTTMITSVAFAGEDLDVLYVMSLDPAAIPGLPADAVLADVERGLLYRVTGLGVTGLPEARVVLPA